MQTLSTTDAGMMARFPLLEGISASALAALIAAARWIDAGPNEIVIGFDDVTTEVFLILRGSLRVLVRTADGNRTSIFSDCHAGELVGELSAIDNASRSAQVETLVRSRLCVIPAAVFLDLALSSSSVALRVMRLLTARIRTQSRRLLEYGVLPIRMRLAAELLRLGCARPDGTHVLTPPPTHEELAARIGSRRESVSRELSALDHSGLLRRNRAVFVLTDPAALRLLVEAGMDQPMTA